MLIFLIDRLFLVYTIMLFARILVSWIPEWQNYKIVQFLRFYTDPYLNLFRKLIPPLGMIDFSPIIAFICLGLIEYAVKYLIWVLFY